MGGTVVRGSLDSHRQLRRPTRGDETLRSHGEDRPLPGPAAGSWATVTEAPAGPGVGTPHAEGGSHPGTSLESRDGGSWQGPHVHSEHIANPALPALPGRANGVRGCWSVLQVTAMSGTDKSLQTHWNPEAAGGSSPEGACPPPQRGRPGICSARAPGQLESWSCLS